MSHGALVRALKTYIYINLESTNYIDIIGIFGGLLIMYDHNSAEIR